MPGGGVCAVLDYEVEAMAEYVSEMAIRLVTPQSIVTAPFKKFVSQILSSTRLPKSTILLGMNYLAKRVNLLNAAGNFHPNEGQVWRMLTVALLLGSKFLDDNTFQNRSWSEVSSIPVKELNMMENQWLGAIEWNLYVNLETSQDYTAWLGSWDEWLAQKKRLLAQANRERMAALTAPVDNSMSRNYNAGYSSWHQQQVAEYERLSSMKRNDQMQSAAYPPQDMAWNQYAPGPWSGAPLTPPDSGYGTPEHPTSAVYGNGAYQGDWINRAFASGNQPQRSSRQQYNNRYAHDNRSSVYSGYYNAPQHHAWDAYHGDCGCAQCGAAAYQQQPFYINHQSQRQAVLG